MKRLIQKSCFLLSVLTAVTLATGCGAMFINDPSLSTASPAQNKEYFNKSLIQNDNLNFATQNYLSGSLLLEKYKDDPKNLIILLDDKYGDTHDRALLEYLADICFNIAEKESDSDDALPYYLAAALYSYALLFDSPKDTSNEGILNSLNKYNPATCQSIVRYNMSLYKIFCFLKEKELLLRNSYELKTVTGFRVTLKKPTSNLPFPLETYEDFLPCSESQVKDLPMVSQTFGFGVPLVALVNSENTLKSLKRPSKFPQAATVFLHVLQNPDLMIRENRVEANFCFLDTTKTKVIKVEDENIPIYRDFSTPIAAMSDYMPQRAVFFDVFIPGGKATGIFSFLNLFQRNEKENEKGLFMLENYNPKLIPVVLVHGLMSNPLTWMRMISMLNNYPEIRNNYQFWMFKYSSTEPLLNNAYKLKKALIAAEKELATTPEAKANFNKMVIVGHSMGGLLTRLAMLDEPDSILKEYWSEILKSPVPEDLNYKDFKEEDKRVFEKGSMNFVKRIVFMAVPHRGAEEVTSKPAQFVSSWIQMPQNVMDQTQKTLEKILLKESEAAKNQYFRDIKKNGVESLDPDDNMLKVIKNIPFASGIPCHSIIGNKFAADVLGGTDGYVEYSSSHLDNVESELIVKSAHNVQKNPAAIMELVRILRVHLEKNCGEDALNNSSIVPLDISKMDPSVESQEIAPPQATQQKAE